MGRTNPTGADETTGRLDGEMTVRQFQIARDIINRELSNARKNGDTDRAHMIDDVSCALDRAFEHHVLRANGHTLIETSAETEHGGSIDVWECVDCGTVRAVESVFHDEPCE